MAFERWPDKGPEEVLDFVLDWTDWLATGAQVDSAVHELDGVSTPGGLSDLTIDQSVVSNPQTACWLSGGTENEEYVIKATITDDQSPERTAVRRMRIRIKKK